MNLVTVAPDKSDWIFAADSVLQIAANLSCSLDTAAEILLIYSKDRATYIRCSSMVEYLPHQSSQAVLNDPSTACDLNAREWFDITNNIENALEFSWTKNQVRCTYTEHIFADTIDVEQIHRSVIIDGIKFRRSEILPLIQPKKAGAGGKPHGAFWPYLAEETIAYLHNFGVPHAGGQTQASAIHEIASHLESRDFKPPERTTIQNLLGRLSRRLLREDSSKNSS